MSSKKDKKIKPQVISHPLPPTDPNQYMIPQGLKVDDLLERAKKLGFKK